MSEPEKTLQDFLARWSKRKLAEREQDLPDAAPAAEPAKPGDSAAPDHDDSATTDPDAAPPPPPAEPTLPPIDTIGAQTDIRAFLAPGVPAEVARAALRRAWAADPAIRDFVGLAENQWDFTAADGASGFGPLELTPALRRMIAELVGDAPPQTAAAVDHAGANTQIANGNDEADRARERPDALPDVAVQDRAAPPEESQDNQGEAAAETPAIRRHGSALPK